MYPALLLLRNVFTIDITSVWFNKIRKETKWDSVGNRSNKYYCKHNKSHSHSGQTYAPECAPSYIDDIFLFAFYALSLIDPKLFVQYMKYLPNMAILNLYKDGKSNCGVHSDDEDDIDQYVICS